MTTREEIEVTHCQICRKESHLCQCPVINRGSFSQYIDKREEIREELAKRRYYDGMVAIGCGIPKWEERTEVEREHFREKIDNDFQYLHSKGVVLKVDGELPRFKVSNRHPLELKNGYYAQQAMLKAGFSKTEPLIKED